MVFLRIELCGTPVVKGTLSDCAHPIATLCVRDFRYKVMISYGSEECHGQQGHIQQKVRALPSADVSCSIILI